jgi:hypothetical protein
MGDEGVATTWLNLVPDASSPDWKESSRVAVGYELA